MTFQEIYQMAPSEFVSTDELRPGDMVRHYGWLFRLTGRKVSEGHADLDPKHGPVWVLSQECLFSYGKPDTPAPVDCGYGNIQGNQLARWTRVVIDPALNARLHTPACAFVTSEGPCTCSARYVTTEGMPA